MDFTEFTNEELENEYAELTEVLSLMAWDMRQQADEFDYALRTEYQERCNQIEKELIKRGIFVS